MVIGQKVMIGFEGVDEVNVVVVDYLCFFGYVVYGYLWVCMVKIVYDQIDVGNDKDGFYFVKMQIVKFYFIKLFFEIKVFVVIIKVGNEVLVVDDKVVFGWEYVEFVNV